MVNELNIFHIASLIIYIVFVVKAQKPNLISSLVQDSNGTNRLFAAVAVTAVLWSFDAGIYPLLSVHLLASTVTTLMFGWRLALIVQLTVIVLLVLTGQIAWQHAGMTGLSDSVVTVGLSYFIYMLSYHYLPRHFIVYVFVCGFFAAACSMIAHMLFTTTYLVLLNDYFGQYDWPIIRDNYLILTLLTWFPEAFLNGMLVTLLVVYKPDWMSTFFDSEYLNNK
ncbi:energy-coupling factor ABC transporter permease [Flocculibacter collagenilyticus]|uniref:energy-coupling factor ABC transporter permease n=1 Tax=Flocculibacter collagenilyticus TaxID=2744479 RepID=UPI0018F76B2D|nr:energy-coupling factor ABC transporter permease [Flocculibacter collagenilyticus]